MTREMDASTLPADWAGALARAGYDVATVDALLAGVYGANDETSVLPLRADVFRAFHLTKLENLRAVILGQDPYPRKGQAHGLAFSVPEGVAFPRSLSAIFRNLSADPAIQLVRPTSGDLTAWAERGVLLLNTALTVKTGVPGSHARSWREFTNAVLRVINQECTHVAFLLWGSHAIRTATSVPIGESHALIRTAHPAARGNAVERRFGDCRPFSEANEFLVHHGPLDWGLAVNG